MSVEIHGETYRTFADYMNDEHKVNSAERNRIEFEADLIGKLIEAREEKGLSAGHIVQSSDTTWLHTLYHPDGSRAESIIAKKCCR